MEFTTPHQHQQRQQQLQRRSMLTGGSHALASQQSLSLASSASGGGPAAGGGAVSASMALQAMTQPKIDNRPAVVIEIGTRLTRIGIAGEFAPREIFRTQWLDPMDGPPTKQPRAQPVFDRRRTEREQQEVLVKFLKNIVFRKLLTTADRKSVV